MRAWTPPSLPLARVGPLACRVGGTGQTGALLLHGLVATGDVFGRTADLLATSRVVAVPDLLGFGRSLDETREDFGTSAHLAAIDPVVTGALGERRLLVAAHSAGSALALRWAALHPDQVEQVVCLGPPIWRSATAARRAIGAASPMSRAFVIDSEIARHACALSCRHRALAGWAAAVTAPRWPVAIARQASLHTWAAYRQTIAQQVLHDDWPSLLGTVARAGITTRLVWGDRDPVGDHEFARLLADELQNVEVRIIPGADHTLPAARPSLIVELGGQEDGGSTAH